MTRDRDRLVTDHLNLASQIGRWWARRLHDSILSADDLISEANVGLVRAAQRFDPDRGVPFEQYAKLRIHGAIRDACRRVDHLSRLHRSSVTDPEDPSLIKPVSWEALTDGERPSETAWMLSVDDDTDSIDLHLWLTQAWASYQSQRPRDAAVVRMAAETNPQTAAEHFGLTMSRVSQIKQEALRQVRAAANGHAIPPERRAAA